MLRLTLRGVRGHLLRFLLTTLSVMLGVAFVAGTFVLSDSLKATFDSISEGVGLGTDVVVRGVEVNQGVADQADLRQPVPLAEADQIAKVDGVEAAHPDLGGPAVLVGKDGTAVRNGGAPSFAFDYQDDSESLKLIEGRPPQNTNESVAETNTLDKSGRAVGGQTKLVVAGSAVPVTIVGEQQFAGG